MLWMTRAAADQASNGAALCQLVGGQEAGGIRSGVHSNAVWLEEAEVDKASGCCDGAGLPQLACGRETRGSRGNRERGASITDIFHLLGANASTPASDIHTTMICNIVHIAWIMAEKQTALSAVCASVCAQVRGAASGRLPLSGAGCLRRTQLRGAVLHDHAARTAHAVHRLQQVGNRL